jgi:hypothetical protein
MLVQLKLAGPVNVPAALAAQFDAVTAFGQKHVVPPTVEFSSSSQACDLGTL